MYNKSGLNKLLDTPFSFIAFACLPCHCPLSPCNPEISVQYSLSVELIELGIKPFVPCVSLQYEYEFRVPLVNFLVRVWGIKLIWENGLKVWVHLKG